MNIILEQFRVEKKQYRAVRDSMMCKRTKRIMARTVKGGIGQHRTVVCGLGQQILKVE